MKLNCLPPVSKGDHTIARFELGQGRKTLLKSAICPTAANDCISLAAILVLQRVSGELDPNSAPEHGADPCQCAQRSPLLRFLTGTGSVPP